MTRIVSVAVLLGVAGCSTASAEPAACNRAGLDAMDKQLSSTATADRRVFALELVGEACKLPASIKASVERVERAGDDVAGSAQARIVADDPKLWTRSCKAGVAVFGGIGMAGGSLSRALAKASWSACDVAAMGLATEAEWTINKHVVLALVIATALRDDGLDAAHVRTYTRAVAGLDVPPPPALATQYPSPGVPASPPSKHVRATRAGFEGSSTAADGAVAAVSAIADRFAACFAVAAAPKHTVVRLDLRDGVAMAGELIEIIPTGPSSSKIEHPNVPEKFRRCVFAIAATAAFAHDDDEMRVEIDLSPGP